MRNQFWIGLTVIITRDSNGGFNIIQLTSDPMFSDFGARSFNETHAQKYQDDHAVVKIQHYVMPRVIDAEDFPEYKAEYNVSVKRTVEFEQIRRVKAVDEDEAKRMVQLMMDDDVLEWNEDDNDDCTDEITYVEES